MGEITWAAVIKITRMQIALGIACLIPPALICIAVISAARWSERKKEKE